MVRILGCPLFKSQDVLSTVHEPVCVMATDEHLFVATEQCYIHVYTLTDERCHEVHKFPTASVVKQICHVQKGNTLVCFEQEHTISHVRLYNGWEIKSDAPMKVRFTGRKVTQEADDQTRMVVSEVQLKNSPTCMAVDPVSGKLAIGIGKTAHMYSPSKDVSHIFNISIFDYINNFEVDVGLRIESLAICESYLAISSYDAMQVVHFSWNIKERSKSITFQRSTSRTSYQSDRQRDNATHDALSTGIYISDTNCITEDKYMLSWTPSMLNTKAGGDSSIPNGNLTKLKTLHYKGLHSCKFDRTRKVIDDSKTKDESEMQSKLKVKLPPGVSPQYARNIPQAQCCLFREFQRPQHHPHSLQFIPVYTQQPYKSGGDESCRQLTSLSVFISTTRDGYLYQVFNEAILLEKYTYSNDCKQVLTSDLFIHAVTSGGVETYTSKAVPAAMHDALMVDNRTDALPPVNLETCLLSLHPFIGVQSAACTNHCVVLMSKVEDGDWCLVEPQWSLYILKTADVLTLYKEMLETGARYKSLSPHAYIDLLQAVHLLVRSSQHVATPTDTQVQAVVDESAFTLALEYASYEADKWYLALPYFNISQVSPEQIISKVLEGKHCQGPEGGYSRGYLHWLEHVLMNQTLSVSKCKEVANALAQTPTTLSTRLVTLLQDTFS